MPPPPGQKHMRRRLKQKPDGLHMPSRLDFFKNFCDNVMGHDRGGVLKFFCDKFAEGASLRHAVSEGPPRSGEPERSERTGATFFFINLTNKNKSSIIRSGATSLPSRQTTGYDNDYDNG